jgi:hypothetical protein
MTNLGKGLGDGLVVLALDGVLGVEVTPRKPLRSPLRFMYESQLMQKRGQGY